jgi:peptidoglycan/LPS O-acetylase OafA/YrhL
MEREIMTASPLKYRPDIDGLRALAVLPVVFCHVGLKGFSGGFIGVDIFFVISGYLISRIILEEIQTNSFSLAGFYERRIRRIFPALIAMLLGSFVMGWLFLLPNEMVELNQAMLSALFSVSNFYLNASTGYFDAPSVLQPMLHTWSLAVEEQFYIFFPLLLLALAKWMPGKRMLLAVLSTVFILSFMISAYGAHEHETWAFYLLHSRAWELLVGTFIALGVLPEARNRLLREGVALLGLVMILIAIFTFRESMEFPGFAALLPVLGAGMIIYAGRVQGSLVGSLLALRPVVFIGLISYSLYLWHWPFIVFYRIGTFAGEGSIGWQAQAGLIAVSLVAAVISWKFIEQPFRSRKGHAFFTRQRLFALAGASSAVLAVAFAIGWFNGGYAMRFSPEMLKIAQYSSTSTQWAHSPCYLGGYAGKSIDKTGPCFTRDPKKKHHYLLTGDSQAAHFAYGLRDAFPDLDIKSISSVSCRPVMTPSIKKENCRWMANYVYQEYMKSADKNLTFILSGAWGGGDETAQQWQMEQLANTIDLIHSKGANVIVFGQSPYYSVDFPRLMAFSEKRPNLLEDHLERWRVERAEENISKVAASKGVKFVSLYEILCPEKKCKTTLENGVPMFVDRGHFSDEGAAWMAQQLKERGVFSTN